MDATIHIYTYKEGLLSKLAHDLRFSVTRFEISARGTEVSATFEPRSLRVDGVMKDGRLAREQLSAGDREKISDNAQRDVLRVTEHPTVSFVGRTNSREPPFTISGDLTLAGVTRAFSTMLTLRGDRLVGEAELVPSQWGIKPFRALGGTLRVQDRLLVRIDASGEWLAHGGELNPAVQLVWSPASSRPSPLRPSLANR
jgi:hypothetical protein